MAAVTNHHKLSGLKQHKLTVPQSQKSEVQNGSHWPKIKVSTGCVLFGGSGGESILLPSPYSRGCLHFLAHAHSFIFKATNAQLRFFSYHNTMTLAICLPLPHLNDPCNDILPTWIIQVGYSPYYKVYLVI